MKSSLIAGLILAGSLTIPAFCRDKEDPESPKAEVAPVQSFSVFVMIVQDHKNQLSIRVESNGKVKCRHVSRDLSEDFRKVATSEVETKLPLALVEILQKAFKALDITTLGDPEVDPESEVFVSIQATNDGKKVIAFRAELGKCGDVTDRVETFIKAVTKIADTLK